MEQKKSYTAFDIIKAVGGAIFGLASICGIGYAVFVKWDLTFDHQQQKIRVQRHLENIGTESDFAIEKERSRKFQEDVYIFMDKDFQDIKKHIHHMDSVQKVESDINRKNADQMFQIKEQLKNNNQ